MRVLATASSIRPFLFTLAAVLVFALVVREASQQRKPQTRKLIMVVSSVIYLGFAISLFVVGEITGGIVLVGSTIGSIVGFSLTMKKNNP